MSPDAPRPRVDVELGMSRLERLLFLRSLPPYQALPPEEVGVVADHTKERVFPRGSFLHRSGAPITAVQFVVEGAVEVRRAGRRLRVLGPRSVAGGVTALAEDDGYDYVALEDCVTLELRSEDAEDILEDNFALYLAVLRLVAREILRVREGLGERAGFSDEVAESPPLPPSRLDFVERMAALRASMPFAEGQIDALADLAREVVERRLPAGATLFEEHAEAGKLYLCVSGTAACRSEARAQRFHLGPGDALGAVESLAGLPRWYGAVAETDLLLLELDVDRVLDVLEDHFGMALPFLRALAKGLLHLYDAARGP